MSRLPGAINSLLRPSQSSIKASALAPPRTPLVRLNYSTRHEEPEDHPIASRESYDARLAAHLNSRFRSLEFPPELARRILTHGSHKAAIHGHNGRLGFIGRRVLESYYLLFVHEAAQGRTHYDYDRLTSRALNTYFLGEHVAPRWSLGRVLLWVPTAPKETLRTAQTQHPDSELDEALKASSGIAKSVGLYKVMGEAVQAVMGGVYHQFGGSVAHQLFHTRILPHLLLPGTSSGVPEEFHTTALRICERMGGPESDLLHHSSIPEHTEDEHVHISAKRTVA
jgi:dsRNA-specific ribonuclease